MSDWKITLHGFFTTAATLAGAVIGVAAGEFVHEHFGRTACCSVGGFCGFASAFAASAYDFYRRERKAKGE